MVGFLFIISFPSWPLLGGVSAVSDDIIDGAASLMT